MNSSNTENRIGEKTLAIIEASGDNQKTAALKLKLSPANLNNLIKGRLESPSKDFLDALLHNYKIDLNWYLDNKREVSPIVFFEPPNDNEQLIMEDDKQILTQIQNSKTLKGILINLLNLSAKEQSTWAELLSEYTKMKFEIKKEKI
ncbi:XRE family transcriptional regulator [Leptospira kmetyi]|uniref:XRE family transcriptional regulator n=1 Tax=Leptospira kmetyi TaxID=408139 RepID=UPI001083597B|nr:XRE family transcriptional regulator [Leptospira kmetyi]TGK14284.1 XRE family transcriptional regulator [Leptospira kmetyi]